MMRFSFVTCLLGLFNMQECASAASVAIMRSAMLQNSSTLLALLTVNHTGMMPGTQTAGEEKFISKLEPWEDTVIGSYLLVIGLISISLNGVVLYVFYRKWSSLSTNDYYVLNLAVSDVILPAAGYPFSITSAFQHIWVFGNTGCTIYGFLGFYFGLVSIITLTTMSIVRYIHICHPHADVLNKRKTRFIIIGSYVYAFIWAIIPVTGWGGYSVEPYGTSCTLQWDNNQTYITMMSLFCILLPSVIMIGCYGTILMHSRQRRHRMKKWKCNGSMDTKINAQENYLIKMTFTMCWGFLVTWMPYAIVSMWTAYGRVSILPIRLVVPSVLLAKTSTVINPTIYFMLNKRFQPFLVESLNVFNRTDPVRLSTNSNKSNVYIKKQRLRYNDSDRTLCKNSDGARSFLSTSFEENVPSSSIQEQKRLDLAPCCVSHLTHLCEDRQEENAKATNSKCSFTCNLASHGHAVIMPFINIINV